MMNRGKWIRIKPRIFKSDNPCPQNSPPKKIYKNRGISKNSTHRVIQRSRVFLLNSYFLGMKCCLNFLKIQGSEIQHANRKKFID